MRGNNVLQNSLITKWSNWKRTYTPRLSWGGVGNTYHHNAILDGPHAGILGGGESNIDRPCSHELRKQNESRTTVMKCPIGLWKLSLVASLNNIMVCYTVTIIV